MPPSISETAGPHKEPIAQDQQQTHDDADTQRQPEQLVPAGARAVDAWQPQLARKPEAGQPDQPIEHDNERNTGQRKDPVVRTGGR